MITGKGTKVILRPQLPAEREGKISDIPSIRNQGTPNKVFGSFMESRPPLTRIEDTRRIRDKCI